MGMYPVPCTLDGFEEGGFSKLLEKPRLLNVDRQRSLDERFLNELSIALNQGRATDISLPRIYEPLEFISSPAGKRSLVYFRGQPVGTIAALDNSDENLNYDKVFVRDFVPSALAFLMNGEPEIVKNFILKTLRLQSWEKKIDRFQLGEGVMPASFKVLHDPVRNNFGESAIGRVALVDSGFWWIILLRAYTKSAGRYLIGRVARMPEGNMLGSGVGYGQGKISTLEHPFRCALLLLKQYNEGKELIERVINRLNALSYNMRSYFWLDFKQLNDIYRFKTKGYSHTEVNKFNVMPDSLLDWIFDFMPARGGYFIGNVSPAGMDFRWFCLGNCIVILSSLATPEQSIAIMDLIESRWEELVGEMPLKVCYPAIETHEWWIITGCDPKNTRWRYHNGGSWPVLLWLLTAECGKTGRPQIARRAIEIAETRLLMDHWTENYDGKLGRYIGKQARKAQT
ncbi:putative alkaline/neutral invertase B [Hibiscus syriacus]|uniref:Alkaline/neutral invertase n=1 Tax=Hibiscus syriacus TaxID=106335 RepID=A0A6A2ZGE6_HIBSY|nr:putative alkaline/neutral invertase B [Hibiscus syriacus]